MLDLVNKAAKIAPLIPLVAAPWRVLSEENIDVEALPYGYDALKLKGNEKKDKGGAKRTGIQFPFERVEISIHTRSASWLPFRWVRCR